MGQLDHVYWIGGGSGAGKSTLARRLAARHGFQHYATDDTMADHARRSRPDECPYLHEFIAMDMDERWVSRSPQIMLETFHWFRGEGFDLIVEDLRRRPVDPPIVVDGFRLLPHLVAPLLSDASRAVWLLPTPEFRVAALASRGSTWAIAGRTSRPERALSNLLERDRLFTDRLRDEATRLGLPTVDVDTTTTLDELTERVTSVLGL
jgi:2-phosphoglycerate kinase